MTPATWYYARTKHLTLSDLSELVYLRDENDELVVGGSVWDDDAVPAEYLPELLWLREELKDGRRFAIGCDLAAAQHDLDPIHWR